ncbi:wd-40 repeat protein : Uncultured bacterium genome assembly Metasoil_fosmids_resub OS=uncultured bacterium PE=4 SV=1: WD40: WD40: WD40 [Gemmata massiliana]|uniref:Anaphase-promoting complex subunit 4 WD40 domain-containing protein n=1 Tax=Gemmata massiliana TaxID=1210884 RepID=A0A6P2DPP2_9BACT|nr:PD40 domain-containing protein [Gemmata massiliana]VTS03217.1 wd-40 repeat protein : Uncultured bacterium genome assembly Metasoil_fosmids_resub OS=uncultured bacterium PE=4 SV=1: WD40: WD40: WD40 [Gemmata massiliana]
MSRAALSLALLFLVQIASAADLPPGAVARLGDDRFRAGSGVYRIAFSPDGKYLVTARRNNDGLDALTLWDATTGYPVREQKVNSERLKGFVWGSIGALAVVIRADDEKVYSDDFCVWEFTNPKAEPPPILSERRFSGLLDRGPVERAETGDRYTDFYLSADGHRVAALKKSSKAKYTVHVFELKPTDRATKLTGVGTIDLGAEGAQGIHLSADGKTLVTFRTLVSADSELNKTECTATVWEVATGKPEKPVRTSGSSGWGLDFESWYWPALSRDARKLIEFEQADGKEGYTVVELDTGRRHKLSRAPRTDREPSYERCAHSLCFPSGRVLVETGDLHTRIVDLSTGRELGQLKGHLFAPTAVAVSADETRIATADPSGLIRLWDARTLRPLHEAPGHRLPIEYARLSPDGKRVLTWACDDTTRLWDLATGKELRAFTGEQGTNGPFDQPTFTPDGTTILFNYKDRLIARDLQTGLEVPLPGDMKGLPQRTAVFAPNGTAVLTWDTDNKNGVCDVWDWPSGKKRFSWKTSRHDFAPGFSSDGSVIFHSPASPIRLDTKTGKELPPAWNADERDFAELLSLRSDPCWVLHMGNRFVPRVREAGTGSSVPHFYFGRRHLWPESLQNVALSPTCGQYAQIADDASDQIHLFEPATRDVRRALIGHRNGVRVLGFTPDGTKLLTAGGDHTVLVWDMRLQSVPLPDALKRETSAAKLWDTLTALNAKDSYLAMSRLAREPEAAVKIVRMRLKPAARENRETDESRITDCRAVELLAALGTDSSRALLKELAAGHAGAFRTQEAKRAIERNKP